LSDYFGLTFKQLAAADGAVCTFAVNKMQKYVLKGKFTIDMHAKSRKYPPEVILSVWSLNAPVLVERPQNFGFYRMEVPLSIPVALRTLYTALSILKSEKYGGDFK